MKLECRKIKTTKVIQTTLQKKKKKNCNKSKEKQFLIYCLIFNLFFLPIDSYSYGD